MSNSAELGSMILNGKAVSGMMLNGTPIRSPRSVLASIDPPALDRSLMSADEVVLARPYLSLADLFNGMDPNPSSITYGWFHGEWPRGGKGPFPYNSRHQENVFTGAFFASYDAVWNQYYGDQNLLARVEAGLRYVLRFQTSYGAYGTYVFGKDDSGSAGFFLRYIGSTFVLMEDKNLWKDKGLRDQTFSALIRLVRWFLTEVDPDIYWLNYGVFGLSNIVAGYMSGIATIRDYLPQDLIDIYEDRLTFFLNHVNSPAGHWWEGMGADISYSNGAGFLEMASLYHETGDSRVADSMSEHASWLSYNLLYHNGSYIYNEGVCTRSTGRQLSGSAFIYNTTPNSAIAATETRPSLAAFQTSQTVWTNETNSWLGQTNIRGEDRGNFSPKHVTMFNLREGVPFPTSGERLEAIGELPYLSETNFNTHMHNEHPLSPDTPDLWDRDYLYVRRPSYYFGGSWGKATGTSSTMTGVRMGANFFYHPDGGVFINSQRDNKVYWGLVNAQASRYSVSDPIPESTGSAFSVGMVAIPWGPSPDDHSRTLTFNSTFLGVTVTKSGSFTERIPIYYTASDEVVWWDDNGEYPVLGTSDTQFMKGLRVKKPDGSHFEVYVNKSSPSWTLRPLDYVEYDVMLSRRVRLLERSGTGSFSYNVRYVPVT